MYSNQNPSEQNNISSARKSDDSKRKVLVVSPSDIIKQKEEEQHFPRSHHVTSDDHHNQIDISQNVKRVDSFSNNFKNNTHEDDHNEHHVLEAKFPSSIQLGSAALQLRHKHEISAVTVDSSGADSDHDHENNNSQHQHVHFDSPTPQKQEKRSKHKIRNSANSNDEGENLSKIRKRRRSGRQASFLMFPFSSSTTDYHQQETSGQLLQQQQQQMQKDEFISFLEEFPQESQFDQLKNLRMHFVSAKHAAARLHTTLQAVQVLPPDENFLIQGLENLFPASPTPATRNKKVSQEEEEEFSPRDETEQTPSSSNGFIQLANEIFSPEMKFPARKDEQITNDSNQFSPSRSKNFVTPQRGDADDDDQESSPTSFFGGRLGSPVHRRVFDKDQRLHFDIWMQQEIEFTQLCFFKVEDVFRCRLMKWRREAIEQAREFTFDCLLDDCLEGEFFARLDMYRDEEASTMELFTQVELMRLIARREDYMLRLSCVKCYLRVWPGIVDDKRDVMLEEDREWELMMKMNQRDIKTIVKRPLARFWIRTDSEHQKVEDEMEQMMAGMQNKISDNNNNNNNEDSNNVPRSLFARRPTKIPDVSQNTDDIKTGINSKIISFIPNHDLNKHQAILKSQQDHVYALERRARAQIAEERDHDTWFDIFSVGIEREEFLLFRKQLQDQIWLEGVRTRQQFVREHQKLLIFAQEHFLRTKWSAMENMQWRTLKNGEAADWNHVMNRASLAYHVTGFLLARRSVQYLLREKAGRVISRFLKQRRAVLRIQNMRKNLARFFQRCGRGYLTRAVCCGERLQMLKCKKEELDKLKLQLSVLMSRFLRSRFSRGSVGLARATREVTRFVNWRKAAIESRRRYNQQVVLPHAKIILAFLYFWYSTKRIVHDEKRLNHCATILQKNMWSLAQRMKTSRVVLLKSRFLSFVKSRNAVVDKKYRWSHDVLKLFATNAIENQRKAREYAMTKLKLTFCLQRIGRGSICRNSELRPSHLYKVQEKLYSVSKIKNWWRRIEMIETERNGEGENDLYYHLRLLKRNKNLDEDFLVDLLVPRKAATMIQTWWRMTIARKKYSAWKISNFFVRHRLRIEHAFMKKIKHLQPQRQIKNVSNNNSNDEVNSGIFVVGNPLLTSENNKDGFCYVVGTEKQRSIKTSISLSADVADDLEEEFFILYAKIVESFVETMKKVKILFKFETHEARHREFERRLSSLTKQETAVRARIEFSNFNQWWPAFLRMIAHCKTEFTNEVHALYRQTSNQINENIVPPLFLMTSAFNYNYFIPLAKRKEMIEQQLSDNEQDEKRKTILRGFKIPEDDLLLIKQQRARMRFLKSLRDKQDDSDIFLHEEHSYSVLEHENEQVAIEEEDSKDVVSHQHLLEEAESSAQFLESSTDRIIQLIRKKRQAKEQEEKKRRPLSALLLPTTNNNSNVIASSRDWLRKYQQEKANRPASASAPNKRKYFAQADDDNQNEDHDHDDDLLLAEHDLEQINSQRNSSKLLPPTGRHFDLYTGVFDVCRWWGNQTMKAVAAKNKKERINNNNNNNNSADKKTAAATSLQFAGTTLEEVCQEVLRCKPIEVLAMASPWFPMNGGAIAAIVNTALVHNRKTLKQIHALTKLDAEFVMRMLKRERLYPEKVIVYSYESDREKINDLSVCE